MDEKELKVKIEIAQQARANECLAEIEKVLEKFNCAIITDIEVVLNGKLVKPMIKAL